MSTADRPVCGCAGCRNTAAAVIAHPEHGPRTVCESHIAGHEVVTRDV